MDKSHVLDYTTREMFPLLARSVDRLQSTVAGRSEWIALNLSEWYTSTQTDSASKSRRIRCVAVSGAHVL